MVLARVGVASAGVALLAVAAWTARTNDGPALRPFVGLVALVGGFALADAVAAGSAVGLSVVWLVAYLTIPMAFLAFVLDYYGLPYFSGWRAWAMPLTPAAVAVLGGLVMIFEPSAAGAMEGSVAGGAAMFPALVVDLAGVAESVGLYYAGGVMVAGTGIMLRTAGTYEHLDRRLGVVLAFVAAWPWLAYLLTPSFVGVYPPAVLLGGTATAYALSAGAALFAVTVGGLFEAAPAAGTLGPEAVLANLDDPVVVVDREDRVVRLNVAAREAFDADDAAVGQPLSAVLSVDRDALAAAETVELDVRGGTREFEPAVTEVADRRGRTPGFAVQLSDVTRQRVRAQRLTVLNRVLRHNLRNEMSSIIGRAETIAVETEDYDDLAAGILSSADDLVDLGDRAQEVERMMSLSTGDADPADLAAVASEVVAPYREAHPDATFSVDVPDGLTAAADPRVLVRVLDNLVENAVVHNEAPTPVVTVSARAPAGADEPVRISVSDNGPGIPEQERAVIDEGAETPLQHGSGLGLWAVNWGVTRLGGDVTFLENEPHGTVVTVSLPSVSADDRSATATAAASGD